MFINIPLSQELLTWWIENVYYNSDDFSLSAPLPIRLSIGDHKIDFAKEKVNLSYSFSEEKAHVDGYIGVSSSEEKAQARMFGLEFVRDHMQFQLSDEEQKIVTLMCAAADTIACRAIGDDSQDFGSDYKELFDKRSERENNG